MLMMKATKKIKKSLVDIKAVAPEPVKLATVQPTAPAVAQPAPAKPLPPQPLVALGNGRWKGDLKLRPGRYEYLFVVDGQWRPDPNARDSVQNPFGGLNSVFLVSQ